MDVRTPLLQSAPHHLSEAAVQLGPIPRSYAALAAGAGVAATSLATIGVAATFLHEDGRLPVYAAEAVCSAGLCYSLFKLQTVRDTHLRMARAQTVPSPHLSRLLDQQSINRVAATMTGFGAVLGSASVGLAAAGAALKMPTANNIAAVGIGLCSLAAATAHFYNQIQNTSARVPREHEHTALPV